MIQVANEVQDEKGFLVVKDYDAPRALVYKVWTDPALVARWWGIEGATNPICEMDVRVGGEWRIDMRLPNGMVFPNRGIYEEVVPGDAAGVQRSTHGGQSSLERQSPGPNAARGRIQRSSRRRHACHALDHDE
jgi:hypothetical protein